MLDESNIYGGSGGDRTLAYRLRAGCSTFELQIRYGVFIRHAGVDGRN